MPNWSRLRPIARSERPRRFADLGATTLAGSSADFGNLISSETDKWHGVIRAANITVG